MKKNLKNNFWIYVVCSISIVLQSKDLFAQCPLANINRTTLGVVAITQNNSGGYGLVNLPSVSYLNVNSCIYKESYQGTEYDCKLKTWNASDATPIKWYLN
jgi:hypothetical protein